MRLNAFRLTNNSLHCPDFSPFAKAGGQMSALGNCLQPDTPLPVQMTATVPRKDMARNASTEGDPVFASSGALELSHPHPPFRESWGQSGPTASPQRGVQVCVEVACVCRGWSSPSSAEDPREVDSFVN